MTHSLELPFAIAREARSISCSPSTLNADAFRQRCTLPSALAMAVSAAFLTPYAMAQSESLPTSVDQIGIDSVAIVEQHGDGEKSAVVVQNGENHTLTAVQNAQAGATQSLMVEQQGVHQFADVVQMASEGIQQVLVNQAGDSQETYIEQFNTASEAQMDISQSGSSNTLTAIQGDSNNVSLSSVQDGDRNDVVSYQTSWTTHAQTRQTGEDQTLMVDQASGNLFASQTGAGNITELRLAETDGDSDYQVMVEGDHNTLRLQLEIPTLAGSTPLEVTQIGQNNLAELNYKSVVLLTTSVRQIGDNNDARVSVTDGTWVTVNVHQEGARDSTAEVELAPYRWSRTYIYQHGEGGYVSIYDHDGSSTETTVTQEGFGGSVVIDTTGTRGSNINILQHSDVPGNQVNVTIEGTGGDFREDANQVVDIQQNGGGSSAASVVQTRTVDTYASIHQSGAAAGDENLRAEIVQAGAGQNYSNQASAIIEQAGAEQLAVIHQRGAVFGEAQILQSGYGNSALIDQPGFAANALINQSGADGSATILQDGYNGEATIIQSGQTRAASIVQRGDEHVALISQQ